MARKSLLPRDHRHDVETCRWLDPAEIATYAHVSRRLIYEWFAGRAVNGFPAIKIGIQSIRVRMCELDAWLLDRSARIDRGELIA